MDSTSADPTQVIADLVAAGGQDRRAERSARQERERAARRPTEDDQD